MKFINFILLILLITAFYTSKAQTENCSGTRSDKAEKLYNEALKKSKISRKNAENILISAINLDENYTDAFFLLGIVYFEQAEKIYQKQKQNYNISETDRLARKSFKKVVKLCEKFSDFESYLFLGKSYFYTEEYVESKYYLNLYLSKAKNTQKKNEAKILSDEIDNLMSILSNPVKYKPVPVININTEKDEYLPMISPDEEYLYFTRKTIFNDDPDNFAEAFMISKRLNKKNESEDVFTAGSKMTFPFNDGRNQGASTITADNNTMYMTICSLEKGPFSSYKNCDIYVTQKLNGKWENLQLLDKNINNKSSFESQPSVTPDGKTLYFASAREGGFGGIDLYKSDKDSSGNWTKAVNLGPTVNTEGDEKTPFIHPDGKTLYFAANSLPGMGGFDVYFTQFDSIYGWSEPKNLGYPINTKDDELAFCINADGSKIYFSTNKFSNNQNWDIYTNALPDFAKPKQVLLLKGKVTGDDGDTISNISVMLTSIKTKKETLGLTEKGTGKYAVSVKVDKDEKFILSAQKDGYFYYSQYIDPVEEKYVPPSEINIEVTKIKKNFPVIIPNVYFDTNSYELSDTAKIALNDLVRFLELNSHMKIKILGHTDNVGTDYYNNILSQKRAKAVADFIISKGISELRISVLSFGENRPSVTNQTETGRMFNRRVEFIVKE